MTHLLVIAIRFFFRHLTSLALILLILCVGTYGKKLYDEFNALPRPTPIWEDAVKILNKNANSEIENLIKDHEKNIKEIQGFSKNGQTIGLEKRKTDIKKRLGELDRSKSNGTETLRNSRCLLGIEQCIETAIAGIKTKAKVAMLKKELEFIEDAIRISAAKDLNSLHTKLVSARKELDPLYQNEEKERNRLNKCRSEVGTFLGIKAPSPYISFRCGDVERTHKQEKKKYDDKLNAYNKDLDDYNKSQSLKAKFEKATYSYPKAEVDKLERYIDDASSDLGTQLDLAREKFKNNFLGYIVSGIKPHIPNALLILIGAIVTPLLIKAFYYYVVAPIVVKRPAIILETDNNQATNPIEELHYGNNQSAKISDQTCSIEIRVDEELLIKDEYISDLAINGDVREKWLLNTKFPLTSIASGLYALTQIQTNSIERINIQATHESLFEVAALKIPKGVSLVLKPHKLIGVLQEKNNPIQITRHWRLNSLHAWLTLQLRYMIFHGPGTLILKGCKGVQIASASDGRAINQAATIGFTSNTKYAVSRVQPFRAYRTGNKELFNDCFIGEKGFYVFETLPHANQKRRLIGKGIEGITDSILNVFGI